MMNMLKAQVDKLENMCEQIYNFSRKIEILRKNQMKMTEMKMKPFEALIFKHKATEKPVNFKIGHLNLNKASMPINFNHISIFTCLYIFP